MLLLTFVIHNDPNLSFVGLNIHILEFETTVHNYKNALCANPFECNILLTKFVVHRVVAGELVGGLD